MLTKTYDSLEGALAAILKQDQEYSIVTHEFDEGKEVKKHHHPRADEWVVASKGSFRFWYEKEEIDIDLAESGYTVLYIPKTVVHGLITQSKIFYFVIRDGEAETVYDYAS